MALSDVLARLRRDEPGDGAAGANSLVQPTMALARFLTGLGGRRQPVLLDLGPVVGSNLTFFGGEFGCRVFVEDLFRDIDRHVHEARVDDLKAVFEGLRITETFLLKANLREVLFRKPADATVAPTPGLPAEG